MKLYTKPVITIASGEAEGVYLASGSGGVKCDSKYMNGVFHAPNYKSTINSKMAVLGCMGCHAFRESGACGLLTDYIAAGKPDSYNEHIGNYMPEWERAHLSPDTPHW